MREEPEAMDLNWEKLGQTWSFTAVNWDLEEHHYRGAESKFGGGEVAGDDILDRLPADPFGMEIRSTLTAAITGLIQDLDKDFKLDFCGFGKQEGHESPGVEPLFKGLNCVWNGTIWFQQEKGGFIANEITTPCGSVNELGVVNGLPGGSTSSDNDDDDSVKNKALGLGDYGVVCSDDGKGGAPHDALFFALGYLGLKDLLNVEKVCRPLRDWVRGDPLLWRSIHIDQPLNERITDDALVRLTGRAEGTLQCLSLVDCIRISDDGLKRVLECNPKMIKLSVPGCVRLSVEGILSNLRSFRLVATPGIKYLRVGGLSGITNQHFEELKFLIGADEKKQARMQRPHYYRGGQLYIACDDDRAIDVQMCPRCEAPRLVYDCPPGSCCSKSNGSQLCRACTLCVPRCIQCGCCIQDCDYEETFCLNFLCLDCLNQLFQCDQKREISDCSSSGCTISHQQMRYQFCFYG